MVSVARKAAQRSSTTNASKHCALLTLSGRGVRHRRRAAAPGKGRTDNCVPSPAMKKPALVLLAVVIASLIGTSATLAKGKHEPLIERIASAYEANRSFTVPATGTIEVAFSPDEGSEHL